MKINCTIHNNNIMTIDFVSYENNEKFAFDIIHINHSVHVPLLQVYLDARACIILCV